MEGEGRCRLDGVDGVCRYRDSELIEFREGETDPRLRRS